MPLTSVGIVLLYEYSHIRMDDNHVILYEIELNGQMFSCFDFEIQLLISEIKISTYLSLHIVIIYKVLTSQQWDLLVKIKHLLKAEKKAAPEHRKFKTTLNRILENIQPNIILHQHQGMGNIFAKQGAKVPASMQISTVIWHYLYCYTVIVVCHDLAGQEI